MHVFHSFVVLDMWSLGAGEMALWLEACAVLGGGPKFSSLQLTVTPATISDFSPLLRHLYSHAPSPQTTHTHT